MQRLSGLDAGFISLETPHAPFTFGSVVVIDPSSAPDGPLTVEQLRVTLEERLDLLPSWRRRLLEMPFGIDHPVWTVDDRFDYRYHIRRAALPAPGDANELERFVADLLVRPLDRSRPLWELFIIEGLENGHIAIVARVHHAHVDGQGGAMAMAALTDLGAQLLAAREVEPVPEAPTFPEILLGSMRSIANRPLRAMGALTNTAMAGVVHLQQMLNTPAEDRPPNLFEAPRTSFNHTISSRRNIAFAALSLSDLKSVKNSWGGTVNDVVLTVAAGAVRHYFEEIGEEVDRPLVAMCPVSTRDPEEGIPTGNKLSTLLVNLPNDVADLADRYEAAKHTASVAKDHLSTLGQDALSDLAELMIPAVLSPAARVSSALRLADVMPPPFNLTVSNLAGSPLQLSIAGATITAVYPLGAVVDGIGLNITLASYGGTVYVGVVGDAELVPHPEIIAEGMSECLEELLKACSKN